jgi:hypothetical protein
VTTLTSASDYPVGRSARLGALGFGVGFALAWLVLGVASRQTQLISTVPQLGTVVFAGGSALGSAALAWGDASKRRSLLLALAGALGCGLGLYITTTIVSVWVDAPASPVQGVLAWEVVDTLQYALIGAFTGALLGLAQRDLHRTARLALAGLLGFGLLYLSHYLLVFVRPMDQILPGVSGEIWHDSVVMAIGFFVWGGIGGAIGGACLGVGNAWRPHEPTGISGAAGARV